MSRRIKISWVGHALAGVCALAVAGCATPLVPSQRLHESELRLVKEPIAISGRRIGKQALSDCVSCNDRQRLQDYVHRTMPYVAGPFVHAGGAAEHMVQQATVQPPHSKFHPVPARPVFEPRDSYSPPQPIGVQLVPVPDHGSHRMLPRFRDSDAPPGLSPASPPVSDTHDAGELTDSDLLMPPPPTN